MTSPIIQRRRRKKKFRGPLPSDAEFQAAVRIACIITGADPQHVIENHHSGPSKSPEQLAISRARVYAAFALRALFEGADRGKLAAMFNIPNPRSFFHSKDKSMSHGELVGWWSDAAFMRVIEGVEAFQAMTAAEEQESAA